MTEPTETKTAATDRAIDDAEPGDATTTAPLTTDEEAQRTDSVINPESS